MFFVVFSDCICKIVLKHSVITSGGAESYKWEGNASSYDNSNICLVTKVFLFLDAELIALPRRGSVYRRMVVL
jgi:hypothetical protein